MPVPSVIDLSHHNTVPESLIAAAENGIYAVIHKATEGTSFVDPKCEARRYLAQEAGMAWGVYHFLRPGDMQAQAEHFLAHAPADPETCFVCDFEVSGIALDEVLDFCIRVEMETGRSPALYSGHTLKELVAKEPYPELERFRLWVAHYGASTPTLPAGWDKYWLWQYTQSGSIEGVKPPTDLNASGLPIDALLTSWSGSVPAPVPPSPTPTPEPVHVSLMIEVKSSVPLIVDTAHVIVTVEEELY